MNNALVRDSTTCRSFAQLFQSPTIRVIVGKPTSDTPAHTSTPPQRTYHLHIDKLKATSEYFASLFSFDGKEVAQEVVRLEEGFTHKSDFDAFDAFVQYLYTNNFDGPGYGTPDELYALSATVFALAERLLADGLRETAFLKLKMRLSPQYKVSGLVSGLCIIHIVRNLYEGSHRPYSDFTSNSAECVRSGCSALVESDEKFGNCDACWEDQPDGITGGYRNSAVRKIVCRYVAKNLQWYRRDPRFRELVREYGEFAEDLVMEAISTSESELVIV